MVPEEGSYFYMMCVNLSRVPPDLEVPQELSTWISQGLRCLEEGNRGIQQVTPRSRLELFWGFLITASLGAKLCSLNPLKTDSHETTDSALAKLSRPGRHNGGLFPWKPRLFYEKETEKKKMSKDLFLLPTPLPLQTLISYQPPTDSVSGRP
jgi:ribosomal protein S21